VAELLGTGADSEKAIRWLIELMVLCCDPIVLRNGYVYDAPQMLVGLRGVRRLGTGHRAHCRLQLARILEVNAGRKRETPSC